MDLELVTILIGLGLLLLYLIYFIKYRELVLGRQAKYELKRKEQAVKKTLDKFFADDRKKKEAWAKLAQVEEIKRKMEAEIKQVSAARESRLEAQKKLIKARSREEEEQVIEEGSMYYFSFMEGLKSAMPTSEEERQKDMQDLMDAVKQLEMLDMEHYSSDMGIGGSIASAGAGASAGGAASAGSSGGLGGMDMGRAMHLDTIVQNILKVIKANDYKKLPFVQAEKIKNYVMDKVKRLSHQDFMDALNMMKDTGLIKDLIEINPEVHLILFGNKKLPLTNAEKVVIAFTAGEKILTIDRLQEHTLWKPSYISRVLKSLQKKGILEIIDQNLIIKGLMTYEEKTQYEEKLEEIMKKERERQEKLRKLEEERIQMEIARKKKKLKEMEIKAREEQDKLIEMARIEAEKKREELRSEAEKITEEEERQRLEKIKAMPKPKIKALPSKPTPSAPSKIIPREKTRVEAESVSESGITGVAPSQSTVPAAPAASEEKEVVSPSFIKPKPIVPVPKIPEESASSDTGASGGSGGSVSVSASESGVSQDAEKLAKESQSLLSSMKEELSAKTLKGPSPSVGSEQKDVIEGDEVDIRAFESLLDELPSDEGFGEISAVNKGGQDIGPGGIDSLEGFFSDVDTSEEITDEESEHQELIDTIINIVNDLADKTGGLISQNALYKALKESVFPDLKKLELMDTIEEMKKAKLVFEELNVGGEIIYLFEDIVFDNDMLTVLRLFVLRGKLSGEELMELTEWDVEYLGRVLKRFKDQHILGITDDLEYYIPGLFNY